MRWIAYPVVIVSLGVLLIMGLLSVARSDDPTEYFLFARTTALRHKSLHWATLDGRYPQELIPAEALSGSQSSPDATLIWEVGTGRLYLRRGTQPTASYRLWIDGTGQQARQMPLPPPHRQHILGIPSYPTSLPDGASIRTEADELIYLPPPPAAPIRLTATDGADVLVGLTPSGDWLIFQNDFKGSRHLYRVRLDGSGQQRLTTGAGYYSLGGFSPDGTWMYVNRYDPQTSFVTLYRIHLDDATLQNLLPSFTHASFGGVSADGEWLFFTGRVGMSGKVFRVRPDGSDVQQITIGGGDHRFFDFWPQLDLPWQPQGPVLAGLVGLLLGGMGLAGGDKIR